MKKSAPKRKTNPSYQAIKKQLAGLTLRESTLTAELSQMAQENSRLKQIADASDLAQAALQRGTVNLEQRIAVLRRTLYNVLVQHRGVFSYRPLQDGVVEQKMITRQDPQTGLVTIFIENYVRPEAIEDMRNRARMNEGTYNPRNLQDFYVG